MFGGMQLSAIKLFEGERKLMELIWELEPINSTALAKEAEARLGWKKSTTYTVLRKLATRGVAKNENTMVSSLASRAEVQKEESENLIDKIYNGSLKMFLVSFLGDRALTEAEATELKRVIDEKTGKGHEIQ
jgi:predicted transcriptional regulator